MKALQITGVIRSSPFTRDKPGKHFVGTVVETVDGQCWVLDYDEQSPFHALADRSVEVSGVAYEPDPSEQKLLDVRHLRVVSVRAIDTTPTLPIVEVNAGRSLSGRFAGGDASVVDDALSFVVTTGKTYKVANDPAGAVTGRSVDVWAYPVKRPTRTSADPEECLWVICPCSAADIQEWRARREKRH